MTGARRGQWRLKEQNYGFHMKPAPPRLTVPIGWKHLAYELLEEIRRLRGGKEEVR